MFDVVTIIFGCRELQCYKFGIIKYQSQCQIEMLSCLHERYIDVDVIF